MSDSMRLYEGLFLFEQGAASSDFGGCISHLKDLFDRAEAEVVQVIRWDERRLAYEVQGQKRGLFMLAYFKARPAQIANIDRDCNLSERILRAMMVRADHIGDVEMEAASQEGHVIDMDGDLSSYTLSTGDESAEGAEGSDGAEGAKSPEAEGAGEKPAVAAVAAVAVAADTEGESNAAEAASADAGSDSKDSADDSKE